MSVPDTAQISINRTASEHLAIKHAAGDSRPLTDTFRQAANSGCSDRVLPAGSDRAFTCSAMDSRSLNPNAIKFAVLTSYRAQTRFMGEVCGRAVP